jgi:hypothetical protein
MAQLKPRRQKYEESEESDHGKISHDRIRCAEKAAMDLVSDSGSDIGFMGLTMV